MGNKFWLETERLILRIFNENDAKDAYEYLSDEIVMKYMEPIMAYEKVISFIKNAGIKNNLILAIELKNNGKLIGHLIFHEYENKKVYELGWIINKNFWNKGYAKEASIEIIKYGFETLKLEKIIGETEKENIKSIVLFEKLGMKLVGKNEDDLIEYEIINPILSNK